MVIFFLTNSINGKATVFPSVCEKKANLNVTINMAALPSVTYARKIPVARQNKASSSVRKIRLIIKLLIY